MACYSPLKGFVTGFTKEYKEKLLVLPYSVECINGKTKEPVDFKHPCAERDRIYPAYEIPCGHCLGCRQDQSKVWANRLMMEMQYHDSAYFVTLTYDDAHVPVVERIDEETGEFFWHGNLNKKHCQDFMKRLRKHHPEDKIRFYLAGEYGDKTDRPHYHGIIYGLHLNDLVPFGRSETGNQYYVSEEFTKRWSLGMTSVEPANEYTCRYVASYVTKKLGIKPNEAYESKGLVPPFSLSSRKPGIGYQYLMDHAKDILEIDDINISTPNGPVRFHAPKYFWKKAVENGLLTVDQDRERRQQKQNAAIARWDAILEQTDLSKVDYLKVLEEKHTKNLKQRNKI